MTRLVGFAGCDKSLPGMMMAIAAAECAVDLRLWRIDPARHPPRRGRDRGRRVRSVFGWFGLGVFRTRIPGGHPARV